MAKKFSFLGYIFIGLIVIILAVTKITYPFQKYVKVAKVIDGDTIELENGEKVRYIGIDAPDKDEYYASKATEKNRELVKGKEVRLEKDISEKDSFGRLLRYAWLDNVLINEKLVREGYAKASSYPPDIKYQERLREAEQKSREEGKGLWGER